MRNTTKGAIIRRSFSPSSSSSSSFSSANNAFVWHYAIDLGDDNVVHFHAESDDNQCRKKSNRNSCPGIVTKDCREEYNWETVRKPQSEHMANTIVNISLEFVGKRMAYDLLELNCEHFAYFCYEAKAQSDQALLAKKAVSVVAVTGTAGASGFGASAAVAASIPEATVLGSKCLGSLAVSWGVIAAPTAPAWVPIATGVAVAAVSVSVVTRVFSWVRKRSPIPLIQGSQKMECAVCMENYSCVRLLPCHHLILCLSCSKKVRTCPECRCDIKERVQIYKSGIVES